MAELNPYRQGARIFAFLCYVVAGLVVVAGVFFTLGGATADLSTLPVAPGTTNLSMAIIAACTFLVFAVLVVAVGWQIQELFGRRHLGDKLVARSAVGCLRGCGLGCGLWSLLSACITLATGRFIVTNQPAGIGDVLVGCSGFFLVICILLAVAWFISANFTELNQAERQIAFQDYLKDVRPRLPRMGEFEVRSFVEGRTLEVLAKLDLPLKRKLLEFLGENDLLTGPSRVRLRGTDFRRVDLRSIRLPRADLSEVDLRQASLADAHLFEVDLQKARLNGADLARANLQDANLRQADLSDTVLDKTVLTGADLMGATVPPQQLQRARLKKTIMPDGRASD
jgi:uncharacterized protein YjbI with pentapeptide repeats